MLTRRFSTRVLFSLSTMALVSCVPPKVTVIVAPPVAKLEEKKVPEPAAIEPLLPSFPDDSERMPDMLAMPSEREFRTTRPEVPNTNVEAGAVISRPPTDPPLRQKPVVPPEP